MLVTPRLVIREVVAADAPFIRALVNDPGFLSNIGDRGVRSDADAARYIAERYTAHHAAHGYGLYLVEAAGEPIGTCGLVRRDGLDAPDLGYAFLQAHSGQGYAQEAGAAMLRYGRAVLGLETIVAFTGMNNAASAAVLRRIGFREEGEVALPGYPGVSRLFRHAFPAGADRLGDGQPFPPIGATP